MRCKQQHKALRSALFGRGLLWVLCGTLAPLIDVRAPREYHPEHAVSAQAAACLSMVPRWRTVQ
jgi:hypothetical protein